MGIPAHPAVTSHSQALVVIFWVTRMIRVLWSRVFNRQTLSSPEVWVQAVTRSWWWLKVMNPSPRK